MKILVTNDDGINAPGLKILKTIALQSVSYTHLRAHETR